MNIFNINDPLNPVPSLQEQYRKAMGLGEPTPTILQDQAKNALGLENQTIQPTQTTQPEQDPYDIDVLMRSQNYDNALQAILAGAKPQPDPAKEKRMKERAKVQAIGDAMRTIFSGVNMAKGYNVPLDNMNTTATDALAKYMDDRENEIKTYNNLLTQGKISGLNYREKMKDTADAMRYNTWKARMDNMQKVNDSNREYAFKEKELTQKGKQFDAKLKSDEDQNKADNETRRYVSDNSSSATRYNADLDYQAAKLRGSNNGSISFINPSSGQPDEVTPDQATALIQAEKNRIEKETKDQWKLDNMAKTPGTTYNMIVRFFTNGLSAAEKEALMNKVYNTENKLSTRQFSKNDLGDAYKRNQSKTTEVDISKSGGTSW